MMKRAPDLSLAELKEIGRSAAEKARASASAAGLSVSGTLLSMGSQRFTRRLDDRSASAETGDPDAVRALKASRETPISA